MSAADAEYKLADAFTACVAHASALSKFTDASANASTCAQQCASVNVSVCVHRNVLIRTSLLHQATATKAYN